MTHCVLFKTDNAILEYPNETEPMTFEKAKKIMGLDDDCLIEIVNIAYGGLAAQMLVDEEGLLKKLPANIHATMLYWATGLSRNQPIFEIGKDEPSATPIAGPALVLTGKARCP